VAATKLLTIAQAFLCLCVLFSKVAVADFLLKIVLKKWYLHPLLSCALHYDYQLTDTSRHKYTLWFCMVSVSVLSIAIFVGLFAQCRPVSMVWDPSIKGTCYFNAANLATVNASYSTFLDFLLAGKFNRNSVSSQGRIKAYTKPALPWVFLRNLQMKPKEKITINLSLSVGIL
jgi:hypothetical protein